MTERSIVIANRHPRLQLDRRAVTRAIQQLDANAGLFVPHHSAARSAHGGVPEGELSLVFLTDEALAGLHAEFLDDPTITDVITFEGDPAFASAGEICISADAALRHVAGGQPVRRQVTPAKSRSSRKAFSDELALYVIHGWLHLAGYDDLRPEKKREMRRAEARAVRILRATGTLPRFTLRARARRKKVAGPMTPEEGLPRKHR